MLPAEEQQQQDWHVREDAETDWDHGERPEQRSVEDLLDNGLVLVDKPDGPTSNQVSVWTKQLLERKKAGHAGTLDPHVTGVLPIGLNRGTKIMNALGTAGKEYVCVMHTGEAVEEATVREVGEQFIGTIEQTPPEKSAVKQEPRERDIYALDVLEVSENQVLFRIVCEKGFYVRTFCEQYGDALDTTGEMADLRRTQVGVFCEGDTVTLQELTDQYAYWQDGDDHRLDEIILPVEAGVRHLPKVVVKDSAVAALAHGANLGAGGISKVQDGITPGNTVAILTLKSELVATATSNMTTGAMLKSSDEAAELDRVYMQKDTYPKTW